MAATWNAGRLVLSGAIGAGWIDEGFDYADVVRALGEIDDAEPLTVVVNSGGGDAFAGVAIHSLLAARSGPTTAIIQGICASAASVAVLGADEVLVSRGATFMAHDPSGLTWGTVEDHLKTVEALRALATNYGRLYAAKTGKSLDDCLALMTRETWLSDQETIDEGFADGFADEDAEEPAPFPFTAYARAPERLVALAKARGWRAQTSPTPKIAAAAASTGPTEEVSMPDDKQADRTAELEAQIAELTEALNAEREARADSERRAAIMALPEAQANPDEARAMADNGVSVDAAKAIFAARKTATPPPAETPEAYERRRLAPAPADNDRPAASASWSKAVARVNERIGARGNQGARQ